MKMIILVLLSLSLYSNEITAFGKFNLGDSFTGVFKALCETKNITSIEPDMYIGYIPRDKFCENIDSAKLMIEKSIFKKSFNFLQPIRNIKGFDNVASKYFYIRAKQINISGVDFELTLELGSVHEEEIAGSYLLTKEDVLKVGKFEVPLQLNKVELKTINNSPMLGAHQENIFNILWEKYGSLVKEEKDKEMYFNKKAFYIKDSKNVSIRFSSEGIVYFDEKIRMIQRTTLDNFLKNQLKNIKNDSSREL